MRSLKVLILEDNPFQLMALHQMLNANQVFDVLTAQSVEAAQCSLNNRGSVDIAICDLQMDGADGFSLIRHMAQTRQAKALIILSSADVSVLKAVAQLARQQGLEVLGYLQKPASAVLIGALLNRWQEFDHDPQPLRLALPERLRFSRDELGAGVDQCVAHYQPKVDLEGKLVGVELLARWNHPLRGLLMPGQFLPAVERAGLMENLTWRMLDIALRLSADCLGNQGQALPVAVNIPPQMLDQPDFVPQLLVLLDGFPVRPQMLTLEIIEQSSRQMAVMQFENLLRLRMAGCRLSIDDFGTGASNIQRLLEMPFSELKIPAEFVRGMADDRRKSAVVAGAMFMAKKMDLDVVVEGVESEEDYKALRGLGQPSVQGYYIAPPMAQAALLQWIDALR